MDPRYTWETWHGPALQQGWRHPSHQVVEELPVEKPVEQELVRPQCWRNCGCHQVCGCTSALYIFPIFQKFLIWLLLLPSRVCHWFFVVRETLRCILRSSSALLSLILIRQVTSASQFMAVFVCKTCCLTSGSIMAGIARFSGSL